MAICPKSGQSALLAEFKFGGLLRYVMAWISLYAMLTNINMAVLSMTAKSPNLNHDQYFRIYGTYVRTQMNLHHFLSFTVDVDGCGDLLLVVVGGGLLLVIKLFVLENHVVKVHVYVYITMVTGLLFPSSPWTVPCCQGDCIEENH